MAYDRIRKAVYGLLTGLYLMGSVGCSEETEQKRDFHSLENPVSYNNTITFNALQPYIDLNNDGIEDLVLILRKPDGFEVFTSLGNKNMGKKSLKNAFSFIAEPGETVVSLFTNDWDGDGNGDIYIRTNRGNQVENFVAYGKGNGDFTYPLNLVNDHDSI